MANLDQNAAAPERLRFISSGVVKLDRKLRSLVWSRLTTHPIQSRSRPPTGKRSDRASGAEPSAVPALLAAAQAHAEGAQMSFERAIAFALDQP
jgi:hypothetical protein